MFDREVLLSPDGLLSDKHIDAASDLLVRQFSGIQGLQSSLKQLSRRGFNPIDPVTKSKTRVQGWF